MQEERVFRMASSDLFQPRVRRVVREGRSRGKVRVVELEGEGEVVIGKRVYRSLGLWDWYVW